MPDFKPAGYNTVSPYLIVSDAASTLEFLTTVFSGQVLRSFPDANGRVMHAEIKLGDTVVMLADSTDEWPAVPAYAHVYVKDVDSTYELALASGATSVQKPVKKEDEDKRGGVQDQGGTTWWISTRVE